MSKKNGDTCQLATEQLLTENELCQPKMSTFASVWVEVDDETAVASVESEDVGPKKKTSQCFKETLKCDMCDYTTVYKNSLKLHILSHDNKKPFACNSCDYTTKYPVSLQRHMLIKHKLKDKKLDKDAPLLKCDQCEYTSYFSWNLNSHKQTHRQAKQFKCDVKDCSYETSYKHNYLKHKKIHNKQDVLYKCDKCPFETKIEGNISRHLARIHNQASNKAYKCDYCNFSSSYKHKANIHKKKNKQEVFKCTLCEYETNYTCGAENHKKQHFTEIQKPNSIENNDDIREPNFEKDFVYQNNHEKNKHYITDPNSDVVVKSIQVDKSGKDQPFKCKECEYSSKFKASVQRHFLRQHTGNQNRPYKCCNCDFSTKTKDQIALHNKRSQSSITLCCTECPFTTNFKCQFVMHQKLHYAHKCTMCSFASQYKYVIQQHVMAVHMGGGLKCKFCDFKAIRKELLLVHEVTHTGDKPYKCEHCDYKSMRASSLHKHKKRYHSETNKDPAIFSHDNSSQVFRENVNIEQGFDVSMDYFDTDNIIDQFLGDSEVFS